MKVPLEWLKEFVTIRLAAKALAERLTMAGLEVVAIEESEIGPVFDLEITTNRPDWLSIIGVAREVAAITGGRRMISRRPATPRHGSGPASDQRQVKRRPNVRSAPAKPVIQIEDQQGCSRYIGRLIAEVKVGPSPDWMRRRLVACGLRPISNVVDMTNYVLLEYGQPLHAFDFDQLAQGMIIVRRARHNEPITTLDGVTRQLRVEMLVIADGQRPVAVAGILGGVGSEVTPKTTRVLLESARFDPIAIRRTGRQLGLASDSSYRFERGVDPAGVEAASARAASLMRQLAGGEEVAVCDLGDRPKARPMIKVEAERVSTWLGMRIDGATIRTTLARLGCRVASSDSSKALAVTPPSYRQDLAADVDVYEEVARLIGYDRIPSRLPIRPVVPTPGVSQDGGAQLQAIRRLCASVGLQEAITWSLVSESDLRHFGYQPGQATRLVNPLSQDHAVLRPSLVMGLTQAVRRNLTQGADGVRLFELGRVVEQGREQLRLGIAVCGVWTRDWRGREPGDAFRLKGVIAALVEQLCHRSVTLAPHAAPWADVGVGLQVAGQDIGVAGRVSPPTTKALDIEQELWCAELSVEQLVALRPSAGRIVMPGLLPAVKRDLSVMVDEATPYESIQAVVQEVGHPLAARIALIDRYNGTPIPVGQVSVTFSIEYRDPSRTLTAAQVDAVHQRIGQALRERCGASVRDR